MTVADDGPGIDMKDRDHIFEPFYTTRLHQGGTGLGLSVAHGIVEDHAGMMWLDRGSKLGARFYVSLPIDKDLV